MCFGELRAGLSAARARKIEIKKNARRVPAGERPEDQRREKSESSRPVPVSADRQALSDDAQDFSALCDTKKNRTRNESDQDAQTTRFELLVKIANAPPDALNPSAMLIFLSVHK